ncbi:prolyl 4-hydroxylase subunit alpha-1-like [Palaemon carinicauda]|uniref:prolyl 4-hydroxylase subunit alpha-1-like n=1 Tax=Palaemon carinicauda TaxID=392227 RepID=UPI0035B6175C
MMLIILGILTISQMCGFVGGHGASGEIYSSLSHMKDLFIFDNKVGEILESLPQHVPEVARYKDSYNSLSQDVQALGKGDYLSTAITGNPILLFTLIKRLVLFWPTMKRVIAHSPQFNPNCTDLYDKCSIWADLLECKLNPEFMMAYCKTSCGVCGGSVMQEKISNLLELEKITDIPSDNDLRGAALALARLQEVYRLPIHQMVSGKIDNVQTSARLNAFDCVRIANESFYESRYANSYLWYRQAAAISNDPEQSNFIQLLIGQVTMEHDDNFVEGSHFFFPVPLSKAKLQYTWDSPFNKLCRGETLLDQATLAGLKCYVSDRGSPYLILHPIKYEHVHNNPEMYVFHEVIFDEEIQAIKDTATSLLQRSLVVSSERPVEFRVSHTAWLSDLRHPVLPKIAKRVSAITGLTTFQGPLNDTAVEELQVLSYGIGGHYSQHKDFFWKEFPEETWPSYKEKLEHYSSGDRMATWMFYLSEVEAGGRTAFPRAGVSVVPVKGSAVFWYNIKKNGIGNTDSEHGGCPVLLGHKWVANKWIRENRNFLRRPCSLDPDE